MGIHEEKIEGVPQFASYFQPLLEILRDLGRSRQIFEEIRRRYGVPDEFLEQINQNGRPKFENRVACGRLAADLLAERLGRPVFSWGQSDLVHVGDARAIYVAALKAADAGDLAPLLAFARS